MNGQLDGKAVVVTGAGKAFCAGGDLGWLEAGGASVDALRDKMLPFYRTWLTLRSLDVPSIAAVNGAAVGAGAALALSCDLRYAGAAAKFRSGSTAMPSRSRPARESARVYGSFSPTPPVNTTASTRPSTA